MAVALRAESRLWNWRLWRMGWSPLGSVVRYNRVCEGLLGLGDTT